VPDQPQEPTAPDAAPPPADASPPAADPARRRQTLAAIAAVAVVALVAAFLVGRDGDGARPAGAWTLRPYQGLGAWVDVYDWTEALGGPDPAVGPEDLRAMADLGVQTVFLQTAHARIPGDVAEPERLEALVDAAHDAGLHVVAWYLPALVDVDADLARLVAASELDVDGLGVDIETTEVEDPAVRNGRLLELTDRLRDAVGDDKALSAITLTAVHLQVVNPAFWPDFPWAQIGQAYDVIQPMTYWTIRTGELRSGQRYVGDNLALLRELVGPDVPIHPIGGIADEATPEDLAGMVEVVRSGGAIGGSLYDWATSRPEQWEALAPLRALRPDDG